MFSTLIHFAAAHLKAIVSLAFLTGFIKCVDLGVKIADMRMSEEKKSKFGVWISNLGPRLDALTLDGLFKWAKKNKWPCILAYCGIFALVFLTARHLLSALNSSLTLSRSLPNDHDPSNKGLEWMPLVAFVGVLITGTVYLSDRLDHSSWKPREKARQTRHERVIFVLFFLGISLLFSSMLARFGPGLNVSFGALLASHDYFDALMPLPIGVILALVLWFSPILFFLLLRTPVSLCSKAVSWLMSYSKGPWAGLVFALTIGLGILRLFM